MALTNFFTSSSKPRDEDHDVHSNASTPPGAATPHPDPTDKRFPGILSSYFGQVRKPSLPSAPSSAQLSSSQDANARVASSARLSAAAPITPPAWNDDLDEDSPRMPHKEQVDAPPTFEKLPENQYPTPPVSASSSSRDLAQNDSIDTVTSRRESVRAKHLAFEPLMRSHPSISSSFANMTTASTVSSSNISTSGHFVSPADPSFPVIDSLSALRSLVASPAPSDHQKLTTDVSSSTQATPPRTPRTLSHASHASRTTSPNSASTSSQHGHAHTRPRSRNGHNSSAAVAEQRGKLYITISEGRGLRPSVDPYIVCQFQWNEYISKGPRQNGTAAGDESAADGQGGVAIQRSASDMGRPRAIPMRSRQSSHTSMPSRDSGNKGKEVTDPVWNQDAVFDVVGDHAEVDVSVYDRSNEAFLGQIRFCPALNDDGMTLDSWFKLESREAKDDHITGEIRLRIGFRKTEKRIYGPEDFKILKLIGKGTFGQVFQVRKIDTERIYAMKVLSKKVIVQKKEVAHTLGERNILVRTAMTESPFIVGLKFSFQTPSDLYLVTDYMSGGELFWHLQKEGRFLEDRARFYIAELILALQHLHQHDIVYRDLKPENILLDANGHIALCDFGLSKANLTKDDTTNTFCGTTEYLAPEVLLDEAGYTKMVDFWSLGVLVFEMCCGWSPFYAEDTQQMYKNIAFGKVRFPRDALSTEGRNFVKGLLNRNPKHRLGANGDAEELKAHAFFADIDWIALGKKNIAPPFKPRLKSELDVSNFDPEFTNALDTAGSLNARAMAIQCGLDTTATPLSPTVQANFKGFTYVDESAIDNHFRDADAMDEGEDLHGFNYEAASPQDSRSDRMDGVSRNGHDEDMFDSQGFEV